MPSYRYIPQNSTTNDVVLIRRTSSRHHFLFLRRRGLRHLLLISLCLFSLLIQPSAAVDRKDTCVGVTGDPVCDAINDERVSPDTFFRKAVSFYVVLASGSASAICSSLIIFIILRSNIGLEKVSHRLVFAMSIADILTSIAAAAGTLAMPKDMVYEFKGPVVGNQFTCSLQGFVLVFGSTMVISYNACLSIYFMCYISYRMQDRVIRRCLEPCMHVVCILSTLPTAFLFWLNKWYNPTPYQPWCFSISYPHYCKSEDEDADKCSIRGAPSSFQISTSKILLQYYTIMYVLGPFLIPGCCMVRIMMTVCAKRRYMKNLKRPSSSGIRLDQQGADTDDYAPGKSVRVGRSHDISRVMLFQCVGYIIANLIPSFAALFLFFERTKRLIILQHIYTVVRPSQGIFNFIIFFSQKVYDRCRLDSTLTHRQAMKDVFFKKEEKAVDLEGLSLVAFHRMNEHRFAAPNEGSRLMMAVAEDDNDSNSGRRDESVDISRKQSEVDPCFDMLSSSTNLSNSSGAMMLSQASGLPSTGECDENEEGPVRLFYKPAQPRPPPVWYA